MRRPIDGRRIRNSFQTVRSHFVLNGLRRSRQRPKRRRGSRSMTTRSTASTAFAAPFSPAPCSLRLRARAAHAAQSSSGSVPIRSSSPARRCRRGGPPPGRRVHPRHRRGAGTTLPPAGDPVCPRVLGLREDAARPPRRCCAASPRTSESSGRAELHSNIAVPSLRMRRLMRESPGSSRPASQRAHGRPADLLKGSAPIAVVSHRHARKAWRLLGSSSQAARIPPP